jgi:hypothetical protein
LTIFYRRNKIKKEDLAMKTKKLSKKLTLNKEAIANLKIRELDNDAIRGGVFLC